MAGEPKRARQALSVAAAMLAGAALAGCSSLPELPGLRIFGGSEAAPTPVAEMPRPRGPELVRLPVPAGGFRSFAAMNPVERVCIDPEGAHAVFVSFETDGPDGEETAPEDRARELAAPGDCVTLQRTEFTIENEGDVDVLIEFVLEA